MEYKHIKSFSTSEKHSVSKLVVVINGKGGDGKDTLCNLVSKYYRTMNISSIDPIIEIALRNGWDGVKDSKSRQFLSELKRLFIEFNDLPTEYLISKYCKFLESNYNILFVHIRESLEIDKFLNKCSVLNDGFVEIKCAYSTLLVLANERNNTKWGNMSDDDVDNYQYEFQYFNEYPIEQVENDFLNFFKKILTCKKIKI